MKSNSTLRQLINISFLLLLPLFFVFHGYVENFPFIPISDAWFVLVLYCFAIAFITLGFSRLFKSLIKGALFTFFISAFNFFFGSFHDLIKYNFKDAFFTKYIFLIPLSLMLLTFIFLRVRRTENI